jgi:SAM-dependent methyltransferase
MHEDRVGPAGAPSWRDFELAGWQSRADAYHRFFAPVCLHVADPLLDAAGAGAGDRLLDACCGPGYVAGRALRRGCMVDGVDIATSMVELAASLYPDGHFQVADAQRMPFADQAFDAVVCNIGLHHLSDPARGVAELARVLSPPGRLALTVWNDSQSALGVVREAIAAAGAVAPSDIPAPPVRPDYADEDDLRQLMEPAGLRLRSVRPITFPQRYPDPDALWDGWLATAIRTGPVFAAQPAEVRARARRIFADLLAGYRDDDGALTLPASLVIIVASR